MGCLFRLCCNVKSAHNHLHTMLFITFGQLVSFVNLGTEARNDHQVKITGNIFYFIEVRHFDVAEFMLWGSHAGQSKQPQTGQGGNGFTPFYKTGKRESQL